MILALSHNILIVISGLVTIYCGQRFIRVIMQFFQLVIIRGD